MAPRPDHPGSSCGVDAANPVNKFASAPQASSRRAPSVRRRHAAIDAFLLSAPADAAWADRFTERYELHRELNAAERMARRVRASRGDDAFPQISPAAADSKRTFVERARGTGALVDARFKIGFRWFGGYVSGMPGPNRRGYWRSAFTRRDLVSTEHPILRLFVTKVNRARRLRTGNDKGAVTAGGPKVLALDDSYVHANADMRGVLRVELDRDFRSWEQLRADILACGVPLPNIAVAHVHEVTGAVQAPHLIWLLENSVCFTAAGRAAPQAAFRSTLQRLTQALAAAGADPGGLANALKMKNPLSPKWSRAVWATEPYASLAELTNGLPEVEPMAAFQEAGDDVGATSSNSMFRQLQAFAFAHVPHHHPDGEGTGSRGEFDHDVVLHAYEIADACRVSERQARAMAVKVARYTWEHFDGARCRMKGNQGVCAEQTRGLSEAEAKAIGGRYVAAQRRRCSVEKLVAAYRRLVAKTGKAPSREAVATAAGLCERTAYRRWDEVLTAVSAVSVTETVTVEELTVARIDKKVFSPADQENAPGGPPDRVGDGVEAVIGLVGGAVGPWRAACRGREERRQRLGMAEQDGERSPEPTFRVEARLPGGGTGTEMLRLGRRAVAAGGEDRVAGPATSVAQAGHGSRLIRSPGRRTRPSTGTLTSKRTPGCPMPR